MDGFMPRRPRMAESGVLLSLIGRTLPPEARNTKKKDPYNKKL